jgi:CspA family cold shock protein
VEIGTVKWFNAKKGFGFVVVNGVESDIFVHYSVIEGEGFRTLVEGEIVDVDVGDDGKGPRARRVVKKPPAEPVEV